MENFKLNSEVEFLRSIFLRYYFQLLLQQQDLLGLVS